MTESEFAFKVANSPEGVVFPPGAAAGMAVYPGPPKIVVLSFPLPAGVSVELLLSSIGAKRDGQD